MGWFRRRRTPSSVPAEAPVVVTLSGPPRADDPLTASPAFAAPAPAPDTWAGVLDRLAALEARVDPVAPDVDLADLPTYDDLADVRMHTVKVAAELARLEINLAAKLDVVRERLRALESDDSMAEVVDLRVSNPTDTGWPTPLTG